MEDQEDMLYKGENDTNLQFSSLQAGPYNVIAGTSSCMSDKLHAHTKDMLHILAWMQQQNNKTMLKAM